MELTKRARDKGTVLTRPRGLGLFFGGMGLIFLGLAALLAIPLVERNSGYEAPSAVPVRVSRPAPDLDLFDLSGQSVSLAGYRGQVVLVNNWATWCPPCRAEMPTLEAYYLAHRGSDFTLIAIDAGDPRAEVAEFIQSMGLSFPVWLDPRGAALEAFNSPGLPSSYVIDRTGTIRLVWSGAINRQMLEAYVTPLLVE